MKHLDNYSKQGILQVTIVLVALLGGAGAIYIPKLTATTVKSPIATNQVTDGKSSLCTEKADQHTCEQAPAGGSSAPTTTTSTVNSSTPSSSSSNTSSVASSNTSKNAPANTLCTDKALIAEPAYQKSVNYADSLTDSSAAKVLANSGGNYTPNAIDAINDIYNNGNNLLSSAWQTYQNEIQGCPVDMSPPVLYTPIPKQS